MKGAHRILARALVLVTLFGGLGAAAPTAGAQSTIPAGATILEAKFTITPIYPSFQYVKVYPITAPWSEDEVTWGNFLGTDLNNPNPVHGPNAVGEFLCTGVPQTVSSAALKALVQGWVDGVQPNYGILLRQEKTTDPAWYVSSDETVAVTDRPALLVKYHTGDPQRPETVLIQRGKAGTVEDAYVWAGDMNWNTGALPELYTGDVLGKQKFTLIRFGLPVQNCPKTIGYWKTHSRRGPAGYDPTWKKVGPREENTPFLRTGKTWYQVLWMRPKGNPYWILARQYAAAMLNMYSGANTKYIARELRRAHYLLTRYSPRTSFRRQKCLRFAFIMTAWKLDLYNNGRFCACH